LLFGRRFIRSFFAHWLSFVQCDIVKLFIWQQDGRSAQWGKVEVQGEIGTKLFIQQLRLSDPFSENPKEPYTQEPPLVYRYTGVGRDLREVADYNFDLPTIEYKSIRRPQIETRLEEKRIASSKEFIEFLTNCLLSSSSEERALAALTYSTIAEVCDGQRQQIAQLLLGLLADEPKVARCSLDSLKQVGGEASYYFLLHIFSFFEEDEVIQEKIIDCLGVLAPYHHKTEKLLILWQNSRQTESIEKAFSHAINHIYSRFSLPRFESESREKLFEQLHKYNYEEAEKILQSSGAKLCFKQSHQAMLEAFVLYGRLRMEGNWVQALTCLEACKKNWNQEWDQESEIWFEGRIAELKKLTEETDKAKVDLIVGLMDVEWNLDSGELSNFLGRIYTFIDQLTQYGAKQAGIGLTEKGSYIYLNNVWLNNNQEVMKHLGKTIDQLKTQRVDRLLFKDMFSAMVKTGHPNSEWLKLVANTIPEFGSAIKMRNMGKTGHGKSSISRNQLINATDMSLTELWGKVTDFFKLIVGNKLELTAYRELNTDIKRLLTWSDMSNLSIRDLENTSIG